MPCARFVQTPPPERDDDDAEERRARFDQSHHETQLIAVLTAGVQHAPCNNVAVERRTVGGGGGGRYSLVATIARSIEGLLRRLLLHGTDATVPKNPEAALRHQMAISKCALTKTAVLPPPPRRR
jgi:hypothetical protein